MSSFITTQATQSVFERVLARSVVTPDGDHPRLVHLWWSAPTQGDRLVQVYIGGELYDVTLDPSQRELWLILDRTHSRQIELLAVPADDREAVWRPQPKLLGSWSPSVSRAVQVSVVRDESLPVDTQLSVDVDGQVLDRGALWPNDVHRTGFGALWGLGCFGMDGATGPGLGLGNLGAGPLGVDGTTWRWRRDDLSVGSHDILIQAVNHAGVPVADPLLIQDVLVDDLPDPVLGLSIGPDFRMTWSPLDTST